MDLARELSALAAHVDWPAAPELQLALEPRVQLRRRPRPLVAAIALAALLALAAGFAVPESRGAILRFLHLGGVTIVRVDVLPPAESRPLTAGIGRLVTRAEAESALSGGLLVPPVTPRPRLYASGGPVISMLVTYRGEPVLLSEFPFSGGFMKKLAAGGTSIEAGGLGDVPSIWLSGAVHDVFFPGISPRLAGNVLLWERGNTTYRLEGRSLSHADAVALARSLIRD